jgi:hypothetical protein
MLSCYESDVEINNTDLMWETDVRLTASFAQNVLDAPIGAEIERLKAVSSQNLWGVSGRVCHKYLCGVPGQCPCPNRRNGRHCNAVFSAR